MKSIFTLLIMGALFAITSCAPYDPIVAEVEQGTLQGAMEDEIAVFKGVPFAKPPIGDLRWAAPQPAEDWVDVRDATEYPPACWQGGEPETGKNEDCLYLNIWSPATSANDKLPVMVWIHGGGFAFGSPSDGWTSGEMLAKKGVILVSVAYRLGQLGFLAHPELTAESPANASGNYGLMDMIASLKWIQNNIEQFGGDPNKVTIFGESAGGIAVSQLAASPEAAGLFQGAISQSGGSFGPHRPRTYPGENMKLLEDAEKDGLALQERAKVSSLAELREIAPEDLPGGFGVGGGWPIVDGYIVPDDQYKMYKAGNYNDVPVLIGYNSDEGLSFSRATEPEQHIQSVELRYGPFADELIETYPVGENSVPKTARDLIRDAAFGWQTWAWAKLQAETGDSKVYYYYFDQHPDFPEGHPKYGHGTPHGHDVGFVFQHVDLESENYTDSDLELSEIMATYWTNFAKYGDPNGESVPEWPEFTNQNPEVMHLKGANPSPGPVPSADALEVLYDYFEWRRTPEGAAWGQQGS